MRLATCSPTTTRLLLACCAGDPHGPMTPTQKTRLLSQLLDHHWRPTPEDTPIAFAAVEAWYAERQRQAQPYGSDLRQSA